MTYKRYIITAMTSVHAATMYTRNVTHETKRCPFTRSTAHGQTVYITQITLCNNNSNSNWAPVEPYTHANSHTAGMHPIHSYRPLPASLRIIIFIIIIQLLTHHVSVG